MRILIVDDDPGAVKLVARILDAEGHTSVAAHRGSEALSAALGGEFDLLICDLMLPDLRGTEVIRALKAQSPHLPVIVISALAASDHHQACIEAGATGYLEKPIRLEALRDELRLVDAARAAFEVWLLDPSDELHARRLANELRAQGCHVVLIDETTPLGDRACPGLLLVDADHPRANELIGWAAGQRAASMAFADDLAPEREEALLRAGAAMCLRRPVDAAALVMQARFLGA